MSNAWDSDWTKESEDSWEREVVGESKVEEEAPQPKSQPQRMSGRQAKRIKNTKKVATIGIGLLGMGIVKSLIEWALDL